MCLILGLFLLSDMILSKKGETVDKKVVSPHVANCNLPERNEVLPRSLKMLTFVGVWWDCDCLDQTKCGGCEENHRQEGNDERSAHFESMSI